MKMCMDQNHSSKVAAAGEKPERKMESSGVEKMMNLASFKSQIQSVVLSKDQSLLSQMDYLAEKILKKMIIKAHPKQNLTVFLIMKTQTRNKNKLITWLKTKCKIKDYPRRIYQLTRSKVYSKQTRMRMKIIILLQLTNRINNLSLQLLNSNHQLKRRSLLSQMMKRMKTMILYQKLNLLNSSHLQHYQC